MTAKQYIEYREFLTDYPCCQNIIMIILLCATQQLKLKINYRAGFHMQRRQCLPKHPLFSQIFTFALLT